MDDDSSLAHMMHKDCRMRQVMENWENYGCYVVVVVVVVVAAAHSRVDMPCPFELEDHLLHTFEKYKVG